MSSLLLLLFIIIIAIIIITIIIIICQFRSPSPRSYNAAFIPTLNKIWYVFEKRTSCVVNYNKNLKGCKNCVLYVSKKIQETNIGLSNWSFFLVFFLSVSSVFIIFHSHILTIIRATKPQRTRINKHQISIKL